MSIDPTPLQERIARTVWEVCAEPFTPTISHASANEVAISIFPIIAAEVRKAQAGAWEEGKGDGLRQADYEYGARNFYAATNPYREQED